MMTHDSTCDLERLLRDLGRWHTRKAPFIQPEDVWRAVQLRRSQVRRKRVMVSLSALVSLLVCASPALAVPSVKSFFVEFTHVASHRGGYITGYTFGDGGPAYEDQNPESKTVIASGYTCEISRALRAPYPKLTGPNLAVTWVEADVVNRRRGHYDVIASGTVMGTDGTVILAAYHNLTKMPQFNGESISADRADEIPFESVVFTYFAYQNDHSEVKYIAWNQGDWTFVLTARDISKALALSIAKSICRETNELPHESNEAPSTLTIPGKVKL